VQNRTDNSTVAGGLTNSSGQVVLYVPTDNIYNLVVDGELIGYGKVTNYSVPIGQAAVAEACTDVSGWMNLNVHGRTNYKVKTENSYGYYEYDDNDTGVVRNGTYDDDVNNPYVRPSIQIPLTGRTNLTGTIYDAYFVNPVDLSYEPVYSHIDLYYSSDCSGDIRYSTITENNGSYSLHVSPKQLGSDTDMIYCMKVVGTGWDTGYEYNLQFQAGAEELNESMTGAGDVSGYVREVITEKNLEDVNISLRSKNCYGGYSNCEAYRIYTTNGAFQFDVSSHSDYYPYDILLNKTNYFTQEYNDTIYTDNTSLVYYMIPLGRSIFNMNVTGSNLTENVTIKWGDETYYGSHEYCKLENNVLSCLLPSGGRVLTVNGSDIGYGVYSEYKNLVQGQNYSLSIGLNETNVNISIVNQDGAPLDNITVTMGDFENITQNGYVFFNKVSGGTQNVTFSGNLSKIYGMGSQTTEINVTPGVNNTYQYTFNETQFLVIVQNETSDGLSGFMVYLENENNSFQNTTDFSGQSLFRQVPYGNYTVSFNSTELELLGYQDKNETVEVLLGEDAGSGNNKTVTLKDTEVWFNITNTTSHSLQNINVSLMIESSIAQNGYSMYLTNLTDSNGLVVFHNVIPSEHIGSYYYIVDGNSTGYGMVQKYVTINSSGLNITETLDTNITIPDTTMPVIISISSSVTSSSATISVTTNESCTCAYNTSDENYSSMTAFSSTGGTSHSTTISGLSATTSYTYYLRCNDTAGNAMNYSNSTTFTTSDIYTGGGSPGGGGGTPTVKIEVSEDKVEISSLSIRSGSSKSMDIEDWSGMIYKIIV
ncbi:MAG: hypothetical protein KAT37_04335, partial [Candidatus Aenigmarchaeota archaeon]|nr:hypothetical protein [Candidatus Aenigmarchaeota archaeon]